MTTKSREKTPVTVSLVATVSLKKYKKLLIGAGFQDHFDLTQKSIELNESGDVKPICLGDAHRSLESRKKQKNFELFHLKNDDMCTSVRKLTELLYLYKDFKRE